MNFFIEDVLKIIDGHEELTGEIVTVPAEVQQAVAAAFQRLVTHPDFENQLPSLIAYRTAPA